MASSRIMLATRSCTQNVLMMAHRLIAQAVNHVDHKIAMSFSCPLQMRARQAMLDRFLSLESADDFRDLNPAKWTLSPVTLQLFKTGPASAHVSTRVNGYISLGFHTHTAAL